MGRGRGHECARAGFCRARFRRCRLGSEYTCRSGSVPAIRFRHYGSYHSFINTTTSTLPSADPRLATEPLHLICLSQNLRKWPSTHPYTR